MTRMVQLVFALSLIGRIILCTGELMSYRKCSLVFLLAFLGTWPVAKAVTLLCSVGDTASTLDGLPINARVIQCPQQTAAAVLYTFADLPMNVRIDAIAQDPVTSRWVISTDRGFTSGGIFYSPDDLILTSDSGLSLKLDVAGDLGLSGSVNVDALTFDGTEALVSLANTHSFPCGTVTDQDLVRLQPSGCQLEFQGEAVGLPVADLVAVDLADSGEFQLALDRSTNVDGISVSRQSVLGLDAGTWRLVTANIGHPENRTIGGLASIGAELLFSDSFESQARSRPTGQR